jgi:hypothetical protein
MTLIARRGTSTHRVFEAVLALLIEQFVDCDPKCGDDFLPLSG